MAPVFILFNFFYFFVKKIFWYWYQFWILIYQRFTGYRHHQYQLVFVRTLENIKQVLKTMMNGHKSKVCEIAEMVNISMELHLWFYMKNDARKRSFPNRCCICSQLNKHNNKSTIQIAVWHCLLAINRITRKRFVTTDETRTYHFIQKSNWQSTEWCAAGESCLKCPKTLALFTSDGRLIAINRLFINRLF